MEKELRIEKILNYLKEKKVCPVDELQSVFQVSLSTIHRDLHYLLEEGKINKYYGKIAIKEERDLIESRIKSNIELKRKIAQKAFTYIEDGECIFLDNSTTVYYLAELICNSDFKNLLVISNSAIIHKFFITNKHINFISTGGRLNVDFNSYVGTQTLRTVNDFNGSKYFFSTRSISIDGGVSEVYSPDEVAVKVKMLSKSQESFLLVDSSKIEKISAIRWYELDNVNHIITDSDINKGTVERFKNEGVDLIISY